MGRGSSKSAFNPYDFCSCWWRPGDLTGADASTVTALPIKKGTATALSQSGQEPTLATSANGKRILALTSETTIIQLIANENNHIKRWGMAFWYRPNSVTGTKTFYNINTQGGGGSAVRFQFAQAGDELFANVFDGTGTNARRGITTTDVLTINEWVFLACMFDGTKSTEAERLRILKNGGELPLTFAANPTTASVPTVLQAVTGNGWAWGTSGGGSPATGHIGPDVFMFGSTENGNGKWPKDSDLAQCQDYDIPTGLAA